MNIPNQFQMANFYLKLYRGNFKNIIPYKFVPQKPQFKPLNDNTKPFFKRCTPEMQGISSKNIENLYKEIYKNKESNVHSIMILRNGHVISECNFKPYLPQYPHMLYSISKTITSLAIGIAINEGFFNINDKLVDIFPEYLPKTPNKYLNKLNIHHLLTMSSGINCNELSSLITSNWVKTFMQSNFISKPGQKFNYNSMNSYMLSAIIYKKINMGLVEFLTPRLFNPLNIKNVYWEKCPMGIEKGGWGLSLNIENLAKIGQLFLQKGMWKKNQIIPREWIEESTKDHIKINYNKTCTYYGYQLWKLPIINSYQFSGVFGQYVIIVPKYNIVMAITGGNTNIYPESFLLNLLNEKFFNHKEIFHNNTLPKNIINHTSLIKTSTSLYTIKEDHIIKKAERKALNYPINNRETLLRQEILYNNNYYNINKNNASLLPVILQCIHGNFTNGINNISFSFNRAVCTISIQEGKYINSIKLGKNGNYIYSDINVNGEYYKVAGTYTWSLDKKSNNVLICNIPFIETPNTRILYFHFVNNHIYIKLDESPNFIETIHSISDTFKTNQPIIDNLAKNTLIQKLNHIIFPKIKGTLNNKI